jgi:hypothetical protein
MVPARAGVSRYLRVIAKAKGPLRKYSPRKTCRIVETILVVVSRLTT